jgi:hypothetical protein
MLIIDLNKNQSVFEYSLNFKGNTFIVRSLIDELTNISQNTYVIGQVTTFQHTGLLLEDKIIAGSFSNIVKLNGCGFYVLNDISQEYNRFSIPNVSKPGSLKYIDGCSNTELISPVLLGLPSVNYLHVPSNTTQTAHIHKSARIGWVADGHGSAVTDIGEHQLSKNTMFILPAYENHYFKTVDHSLSIIVFHPDSDLGPTDENNNMKVRTHI